MKAQLMLEHIGYLKKARTPWQHVAEQARKPWCAQITPGTKNLYDRRYLTSSIDWRNANGSGTRGCRRVYLLQTGELYEFQRMINWRLHERVFCKVTESGVIEELNREEVMQWLRKERLESMS